MNRIEQWHFADEDPMDAAVEGAGYDPKSVYGGGHYVLYRELPEFLKGQQTPLVSAREGRKTVEILERAYHAKTELK